ncbi:MAG TPA: protein-glutamate O-methyltransferase CheR [Mycobacteriales bacterium]|nr:protein-glutamate O-methyltransferase CheR [Mycobacteriales bacterium]
MPIATVDFDYISNFVRQRAAIVLEPGKEYLIESRLAPLAREQGLSDLSALVARMRAGDERLHSAVVEAMTTNETLFFRDQAPFRAMSEEILPALAERRLLKRIRIWSAACSSGQEPYSIAMTCADFVDAHPGWGFEILATDISEEMLARTAAARYSQLEINRGLPATHLVRHFKRAGTGWQAEDRLRAMVTVQALNLARPFPDLPTQDVVFLRNVLIYFDVATRRAILEQVSRVLAPDGYLFLGSAETTTFISESFERDTTGSAACYRPRQGGQK